MFVVTWAGWQDDVRRYWFLSVGFLYRSTTTLPSLMEREVSRNAMEVVLLQCQGSVLVVVSMEYECVPCITESLKFKVVGVDSSSYEAF